MSSTRRPDTPVRTGRTSSADAAAAVRLALRDPAAVPHAVRPVPRRPQSPQQGPSCGMPRCRPPAPRKRSRAGALTAGAVAVAIVSAGIGGGVALLVQPDRPSASSSVTGLAPSVPAASLPAGTVEQVAAKVVPSVVKLEVDLGRAVRRGLRHHPVLRRSDPDEQPRGGRRQGRTRRGGRRPDEGDLRRRSHNGVHRRRHRPQQRHRGGPRDRTRRA